MFFTSECSRLRNMLWDAAADRLSGEDSGRVTAHVEKCDTCRRELLAYRNTVTVLSSHRQESVPVSRLGWRDLQRRVESQTSAGTGWALRPFMRLAAGGGSLALATLFVMFVMQANTINSSKGAGSVSRTSPAVTVARSDASSNGMEIASAGSLGISLLDVPKIPDSGVVAERAPRVEHTIARTVRSRSVRQTQSTAAPVTTSDMNVDGGNPVQPIRPDYVLASASSGNDDDQNRHYVIDVVSTSSGNSDNSEESHPW